jgi:hypothetical protein
VRRLTGKYPVKYLGSTEEWRGKLPVLREVGVAGTLGGAVKCVEIERNAEGEDKQLGLS